MPTGTAIMMTPVTAQRPSVTVPPTSGPLSPAEVLGMQGEMHNAVTRTKSMSWIKLPTKTRAPISSDKAVRVTLAIRPSRQSRSSSSLLRGGSHRTITSADTLAALDGLEGAKEQHHRYRG